MSKRETFEDQEKLALEAMKKRVSDWIDSSMHVIKMREKSESELTRDDRTKSFADEQGRLYEDKPIRENRNTAEVESRSAQLPSTTGPSLFTRRMEAFRKPAGSTNNISEESAPRNKERHQEDNEEVNARMKDRCNEMLEKAEKYYEQQNENPICERAPEISPMITRASDKNPCKNRTVRSPVYASTKLLTEVPSGQYPENSPRPTARPGTRRADSFIREIYPPQFKVERSSVSQERLQDNPKQASGDSGGKAGRTHLDKKDAPRIRKTAKRDSTGTTDTSSTTSENSAYCSVKSLRRRRLSRPTKSAQRYMESGSKRQTIETKETPNVTQICHTADLNTRNESGEKHRSSKKCKAVERENNIKTSRDGKVTNASTKERCISVTRVAVTEHTDKTAIQVKHDKPLPETLDGKTNHTGNLHTAKGIDVNPHTDRGTHTSRPIKQCKHSRGQEDENQRSRRRDGTGDPAAEDLVNITHADYKRNPGKQGNKSSIELGTSTAENSTMEIRDLPSGKRTRTERPTTGEAAIDPEKRSSMTENLNNLSKMCKHLVGNVSKAIISKEVTSERRRHGRRSSGKHGEGRRVETPNRRHGEVGCGNTKATETVNIDADTKPRGEREPAERATDSRDRSSELQMRALNRKEVISKIDDGESQTCQGTSWERNKHTEHWSQTQAKRKADKNTESTQTANEITESESAISVYETKYSTPKTMQPSVKQTTPTVHNNVVNRQKNRAEKIVLTKTATKNQCCGEDMNTIQYANPAPKHSVYEATQDSSFRAETMTNNCKGTATKQMHCNTETRDQGCGETSIDSYMQLSAHLTNHTTEENDFSQQVYNMYLQPLLKTLEDDYTEYDYREYWNNIRAKTESMNYISRGSPEHLATEHDVVTQCKRTPLEPALECSPRHWAVPTTTTRPTTTMETAPEIDADAMTDDLYDQVEQTQHFNTPMRVASPTRCPPRDKPTVLSVVNIVLEDNLDAGSRNNRNNRNQAAARGRRTGSKATLSKAGAMPQTKPRFKTTMSQRMQGGNARPAQTTQTFDDVGFGRLEASSMLGMHHTAPETDTSFRYKLIPEKIQQKILTSKPFDRTQSISKLLTKRQEPCRKVTPTPFCKTRSDRLQYNTIQNTIELLRDDYAPVGRTFGTDTGDEKLGGALPDLRGGDARAGSTRHVKSVMSVDPRSEPRKSSRDGKHPKVTFSLPAQQIGQEKSVADAETQRCSPRRRSGTFNIQESYAACDKGDCADRPTPPAEQSARDEKQPVNADSRGQGESAFERRDSISTHSKASGKPKIFIRPYCSPTVLEKNPYLTKRQAANGSNNKPGLFQFPRNAPVPAVHKATAGRCSRESNDIIIDITTSDSRTDINIEYGDGGGRDAVERCMRGGDVLRRGGNIMRRGINAREGD